MNIVNAVWEKRNLGCEAYEITLTKKDFEQRSERILEKLHAQNFQNAYVVIKMPVGNLNILHALEDDGFRFMETQFSLKDHFTPLESPEQIKELMNGAERIVVEKTRDAWAEVIEKITPDMFSTDRISLDPAFGMEIACTRYKNWCWDLFEKPDSWMWLLKIEDKDISFGINLHDEKRGIVYGVLGGVFAEYRGEGYGIFQSLGAQTTPGKQGKIVISSNNAPMLRIYQNYGKIIYKERYVLRKIYGQLHGYQLMDNNHNQRQIS